MKTALAILRLVQEEDELAAVTPAPGQALSGA
jgi:hypothetical protein